MCAKGTAPSGPPLSFYGFYDYIWNPETVSSRMNLATIIIIALVVAAVAAAVYFTIRRRKAGISPYCSGCSLKDTCSKK